MRPRTLMYGAVLAVMCIGFVWGLSSREPLRVDVMRDRTSLAREVEDGLIENVYDLQVMNMTESPRSFSFRVSGLEGIRIDGADRLAVPSTAAEAITLRVLVPADAGKPGANEISFEIRAEDDAALILNEKTTFLLPR
jgi:polyferredoxin